MLHGLRELFTERAVVQAREGARDGRGVPGSGSFPHGASLVGSSLTEGADHRGVRSNAGVMPCARCIGQT